jgi:hypothetical protein
MIAPECKLQLATQSTSRLKAALRIEASVLDRLTNWKTVLIIFLVAVVGFNAILFPWRSGRMQSLAGRQVGIIDTMYAYNPDQVYEKIPAYGEEGRQFYALTEFTIDLVYPILYNLFLMLTMALIFRQAFSGDSVWQRLRFLPLAVWISDYAENTCITILLLNYPQRLDVLAWISSFFSTAKWSLGVASLALIVIGLIVWLAKRIRLGGSR